MTAYVLIGVFNSNNFATSVALVEVCAILSPTLVDHLLTSISLYTALYGHLCNREGGCIMH